MNRRVYEVARELGRSPRDIMDYLASIGEYARSASSVISETIVKQVFLHYGYAAPEPRPQISEPAAVTPATTLTWHANPVKAPKNADTVQNIERLEATFPIARTHKAMLQALGSQFVYATTFKGNDNRHSGLALVRFSGAIEAAFGLTREVVFFYSPYFDLQSRSFMLAKEKLEGLPREVTPDLIFFHAPDDRLTVKLNDWSTAQFTAIPVPGTLGSEPIALIAQLRDYIYARDLFYETTPVSGEKFFGRKTLLQELRDDIANQRASGLFGLRKSGKTSILLELVQTLPKDMLLPVFVDLETLPSPPEDPSPDFMREIAGRLEAEMAGRGLRSRKLAAVATEPSVASFKMALEDAVRRLGEQGTKLVLLLDEIEFLTPSDQVDTQEANFPGVAQVLASLRAVAQSSTNFTFILSGLTNHILENGRLYGRPNPLFSWAKARYLGPFSRDEADELATAIGARMGIEIEEGALRSLYDASGGHAYLYRNLASEVVSTLPMDTYRRVMRTSDVLHKLIPWQRSVAGNVEEMINHLTRYYPTEGVLLEVLRESPREFAELAREENRAVHHLTSLGLIQETTGNFELNVLLELQ